jgi:hypothetical protein
VLRCQIGLTLGPRGHAALRHQTPSTTVKTRKPSTFFHFILFLGRNDGKRVLLTTIVLSVFVFVSVCECICVYVCACVRARGYVCVRVFVGGWVGGWVCVVAACGVSFF